MSARALLAATAFALVVPAAPGPSVAAGAAGVSMEILVDGRPLSELRGNGKRYVEARKGRNYSIRLRNDTSGRVAVALAVDGLNTIDAKHEGAATASKWVLGPYETAEIAGWQVDSRSARRFVFTSEDKSYGAWLGDSRNLGVISAVFYAERPQAPCCYEPRWDEGDFYGYGGGKRGGEGSAQSEAPREEAARERRAPSATEAAGSTSADRSGMAAPQSPKKSDDLAATGMGGRTRHDVQYTAVELDPTPIASLDLRYAYRDELLALGIDPDGSTVTQDVRRREQAEGFAPDPGYGCCR